MAKEYIYSAMVKDMKVIFLMVRSMELVFIIIVMEIFTMVNGLTILNMGKENLYISYKENLMMENGNMVSVMVEDVISILWEINMKVCGREV